MSDEDSQRGTTRYGGTYNDGTANIDIAEVNNYGENRGDNLAQWLAKEEVISFVGKKFSNFLRHFTDENDVHIYE